MKTVLKIKILLFVAALVGAGFLAAPEAQAHLHSSGVSNMTHAKHAPSPFVKHKTQPGHFCPLNPEPLLSCPHHWVGRYSKTSKVPHQLSPFCHGTRLPTGANFQLVKQAPMSLDGDVLWTAPDFLHIPTAFLKEGVPFSLIDKPPPRFSRL